LIFDKLGNLYGTNDGSISGNSSVFELSPPSIQGGAWTETTLHDFAVGSRDGHQP
jgi:hypothetical protein